MVGCHEKRIRQRRSKGYGTRSQIERASSALLGCPFPIPEVTSQLQPDEEGCSLSLITFSDWNFNFLTMSVPVWLCLNI